MLEAYERWFVPWEWGQVKIDWNLAQGILAVILYLGFVYICIKAIEEIIEGIRRWMRRG